MFTTLLTDVLCMQRPRLRVSIPLWNKIEPWLTTAILLFLVLFIAWTEFALLATSSCDTFYNRILYAKKI